MKFGFLHEFMMRHFDKGTSQEIKVIAAREALENVSLDLATGESKSLEDLVEKGPLIIIFIRGTWCGFCSNHLHKLEKWMKSLKNKSANCVVVTSETREIVEPVAKQRGYGFLFACDPEFKLADVFGVRLPPKEYFQAATFLVDGDLSVRIAYTGKRTKEYFEILESSLDEDTEKLFNL